MTTIKYHISPKTGRPNKCTASLRACPVGGEGDHFPTQEEARRAYEERQKEQELPKPLKATRPRAVVAQEAQRVMEDLRALGVRKMRLMQSFTGKDFDTALEAMKKLEAEGALLKGKQEALAAELKATRRQGSARDAQRQEASSSRRLQEVQALAKERDWALPTEHFSRNAGLLNPLDRTLGSGAEYFEEGRNSLVVLGTLEGKRARVISSWGEFYDDPLRELGWAAQQVKQGYDRDSITRDLRVIGYVDRGGKTYGWVPDKQVPFFVYK